MIEQILQTAEAVLERQQNFEAAIRNGVADLSGLIVSRVDAERTFRRAEAAAAIGEPAADLQKAKKASAEAKSALESASLRLNGLRTALGEMGSSLVENYEVLSTELPRYNAAIAAAFEKEWRLALTNWNLMLGRRQALETLLGQALDLVEPVPVVVTLSADATRPSDTLSALEKSIKSIAGGKALAERPVSPSYSAVAVYRMTSDRMTPQGISRGAFVVDATFRPGELARLVEFTEARPVLARDVEPGVLAAASKAAELDRLARDKEAANSERRLYVNSDNVSSRRLDLEGERNFKPSKADLAKADADTAAGIAGSAEARERQRVIDKSLNETADRDEARAAKSAEQNKLRQGPSAAPTPEWPESLH
jgi:hypothetical protein